MSTDAPSTTMEVDTLLTQLQSDDAIMEISVSDTLDKYLSLGGAPKKAVKALGEGYKGRTEMINMLLQWSQMADANGDTSTAAVGSSAAACSVTHLVQRSILHRFDPTIADGVLSHAAAQPPWLETLASSSEWATFFASELTQKYPGSLFLKLCTSLVAEKQEQGLLHVPAPSVSARQTSLAMTRDVSQSTKSPSAILITTGTRATALAEFEKCQELLDGLLHALVEKVLEKASKSGGGVKRKHESSTVKLENANSTVSTELQERLRNMSLEAMRTDLHRLAGASEYTYVYVQRILSGIHANLPTPLRHVLRRIMQDLSEYASHPPITGLVGALASTAAAVQDQAASFAQAIDPLDLFLLGVKDEWSDCVGALQGLHRTGSLSPLDINKLYTRFSSSDDPPPAAILRDRRLIKCLVDSLFATPSSNSAASASLSSASTGSGTGQQASQREKQLFLLAYATSMQDDRVTNAPRMHKTVDGAVKMEIDTPVTHTDGLGDRSLFESTRKALVQFYDCTQGAWGIKRAPLLRLIHTHQSSPIIAEAACTWMLAQLTDPGYYETTFHATVTPFFLHLIGQLVQSHRLLLGQVFFSVSKIVKLHINMDPFLLIQYRKTLLTMLIHLVHLGLLTPVLDFVTQEVAAGLDHSLVRHFIVQLLHTVGPPYSRGFLERVLSLLDMPQTFKSLQAMLIAHVKRTSAAASAIETSVTNTTSSAAAAVLAAAHVAPGSKAALRVLAAAELHGQLPQAESSVTSETKSDEPPTKKIKLESGAAVPAATVITKQFSKPLMQIGTGHDSSDSSVLDFCTLLHDQPDLLRNSAVVVGFAISETGVIMEDDSTPIDADPLDESTMSRYGSTLQRYIDLKLS